MARRNGGFVGQDGLDAPDPPTGITPTIGDAQVSVAFTAPSDVGTSAITGFVAQVSTNDTAYSAGSNTGSSSPIVVSSLTNGTAATVKVWAINAYGTSAPSDASASFTPQPFQLGVFGVSDTDLDQFNMATLGSVTDFGTISLGQQGGRSGTGSSTRGVFGGGEDSNVMTYITFASAGNGTDFGDQSAHATGQGSMGNNTRGIFSGGLASSSEQNHMDYITIASVGNSTDFGNLTTTRKYLTACASPTRGINAGGATSGSFSNVIDYVTIASAGNASDFGDLTVTRYHPCAASSATRGVFSGSNAAVDSIDYITIGSTGNATDFGDLTEAKLYQKAISNTTKAFFVGGTRGAGGNVANIDFITIASTGNATDTNVDVKTGGAFYSLACSNSHGGIA